MMLQHCWNCGTVFPRWTSTYFCQQQTLISNVCCYAALTHHVWVVHYVQLAHLPKVLVQHLDKAVYQLQHRQLILQAAAPGGSASSSASSSTKRQRKQQQKAAADAAAQGDSGSSSDNRVVNDL
jgi:hypothetical protein